MSDARGGPGRPRRSWRRHLIVAGVLLYGGIAVYVGVDRVGAAFLDVAPLPYLLMMVSLGFAMGVRALKWRLVLGPGQQAVALFFIAKGAGDWTPGRAGEFSPLLMKRHRTARVGAWILYDRLLEVGVTLLMGLLGLAWIGWISWALAGALGLCGVAAALGLTWALSRESGDPAMLDGPRGLARRLRIEAATFARTLPRALPLTVLGKASDVFSVWLLFLSFGERIDAPLIMVTRCARALLASLPITADQTAVPHATELGILHEAAGIPAATIWAALLAEVIGYSAVFWALFAIAMGRYRQPTDAR